MAVYLTCRCDAYRARQQSKMSRPEVGVSEVNAKWSKGDEGRQLGGTEKIVYVIAR
jgi:hypothetical protein